MAIQKDAVDGRRRQVIAERVVEGLNVSREHVTIALTNEDMMTSARPEWRFALSSRNEAQGVAVISSARMDPVNFGLKEDDELLYHRLLKMVTKNIGVLYLGLPQSTDP